MYELQPLKRAFTVDALVTAFDTVRPQGFYFEGEMHDFWEMVYVASGRAVATADERIYELSEGQLLLHKPLEFHRIWSAEGSAPHLLLLSFHAKGDMRRFEGGFYTLNETQRQEYETLAKHFIKAKNTKTDDAAHRAAAALETFLLGLPKTVQTADRSTLAHSQFRTIVETMEAHRCEMLSVADIAALCNMSVGNMKRIFSLFADCGVAKYFLKLKLRHARRLLQEGMSTTAVAAELGFNEPAYFCTVFRRETGMTPKEYRK